MGVEIRSHKGPEKPVMDFDVTLVDLHELVPHEQIIERELEWFVKEVVKSGLVHWPMLIAKDSYLILDGHHRTAGLKQLDYTSGPAILLDYFDDDLISLDTWYPLVKQSVDEVTAALDITGVQVEQIQQTDFDQNRLRKREITAYVGNENQLYEVLGNRETIFQIIRNLWIQNTTYYDDPKMCFEAAGESATAVIAWPYTKQEILKHVEEGIVHLPKTTRHELRYQVPKCNYPLEKL